MKHTIKSLLITSVLTLPTVLGAADQLTESTDSPNTTALTCVTADKQDAKRPKSTLAITPIEVRIAIIGYSDPEFTLRFLDVHAIAALALTSKKWNNFAQCMLNAIRTWGQTNFIPRLLHNHSLNPHDNQELAFLRINADTPFNNILNIAFAVKCWTASMTSDEHTALVTAIDNNTTFTPEQKTILKGLRMQHHLILDGQN